MKTTTFTELRNNATRFFDQVEKGQSIGVYRHGKLIAVIHPAGEEGKASWKRLEPLKLPGVSLSGAVLNDRKARG